MTAARALTLYYAATILFLLLDYGLGVNVRLAFLDPLPGLRAAWYGFCLACLVAMWWRPSWSAAIGAVESLGTLIALILSMGVRVMVPNSAIVAENVGFVTIEEVFNFLIAGFAAYFAFVRGLWHLNVREITINRR